MKKLNEYIIEKFKINSKTVTKVSDDRGTEGIPDSFLDADFPDDHKRRFKKSGEPTLWYHVWWYVAKNGPASKEYILKEFGLVPTSYSGMFAEMVKQHIISRSKGLVYPNKVSEWTC